MTNPLSGQGISDLEFGAFFGARTIGSQYGDAAYVRGQLQGWLAGTQNADALSHEKILGAILAAGGASTTGATWNIYGNPDPSPPVSNPKDQSTPLKGNWGGLAALAALAWLGLRGRR